MSQEPWYAPDGLKFECKESCGACCSGPPDGFVWVTEREVRAIAKHLGWTVAQVKRHLTHTEWGRRSLRSQPSGSCCFLDDATKRCGIYAVRPKQCRSFPFWKSVLASPDAWDAESNRCPGMNSGALIPVGEIRVRARGK